MGTLVAHRGARRAGARMRMGYLLMIVLLLLVLVGLPRWPHSRSWGYGPSGVLALLFVVVLVLVVVGYMPRGF